MTIKGLISLGISFSIFVGWAIVFVIIGLITGNAWFYGIGGAVIGFWTAPLTPMWDLIIVVAFLIQKYIFKDKSVNSFKKIISEEFKKNLKD